MGNMLTQQQTAILLGTLLGDASIKRSGQMTLAHCAAQGDYLSWKVRQLSPLFRVQPIQTYSSAAGKRYPSFYVWSRVVPLLHELRQVFYPEGKKAVSPDVLARLDALGDQLPLALAVWYMDDGSTQKDLARFVWGGLTEAEYLLLARWFESHGFPGTSDRQRRSNCVVYRISAHDSRIFFKLIAPHVHPTMMYKVSISEHRQRGYTKDGKEIRSEILRLHGDGLSLAEIGRRTGITYPSVRYHLRKEVGDAVHALP